MRSRAAILPYPADPFLLNYWLHFYDTVWGDEIDKLYIHINSPIEEPVIDYIKALCDSRPKIVYKYTNNQIEHGDAINEILDIVREKYVMLIEDDGFIFKKNHVDWCFSQLESGIYDIVGSKRGSCATEIIQAAQVKWGITIEGDGDQGCNFWPNYFFSETELLKKTDRNFKAKAWNKGETIEALGYVVEPDVVYGDTFVNTSLQLRAMIPIERIFIVPQYHGHPSDLQHYQESKYLFDGKASWTHVGSLSSGVGGILRDDHDRALARRLIDPAKAQTELPLAWCQSEQEHEEWERRAQWWLTFIEYFNINNQEGISEDFYNFAKLYGRAVNQLISQYGLRRKSIQQRQEVYKSIGL